MKYANLPRYWQHYNLLPEEIRNLAAKNYQLLQSDPRHPSLHFKKLHGKNRHLWLVRIGDDYRALGRDVPDGVIWFWIGPHAEYDKLLK